MYGTNDTPKSLPGYAHSKHIDIGAPVRRAIRDGQRIVSPRYTFNPVGRDYRTRGGRVAQGNELSDTMLQITLSKFGYDIGRIMVESLAVTGIKEPEPMKSQPEETGHRSVAC